MKLHPTIAELIEQIDSFTEREGMTSTEFGRCAIGDPNLYRQLKKGRNPRLETMDGIREYLRSKIAHVPKKQRDAKTSPEEAAA